jgi:uncharacterized membrane protein
MKTLKAAIILNGVAGILFSINVFVAVQKGETANINAALAVFFFISAFFYWRRYKKSMKS